jgi:DNA-binding Xre family transcriptional regulator
LAERTAAVDPFAGSAGGVGRRRRPAGRSPTRVEGEGSLPLRQVPYRWCLREVMATRGLFNTVDLAPLLFERGIELSLVQVWRLVTGTPERLSLPVLAALCDILEVTPTDLIALEH